MAIEVLLPRLGWTMEEGTLAEWLKHDGDTVQPGDILVTVENEKALNEVEAPDGGVLRIPPGSPQPGTVVPVGTLLAYIIPPGENEPARPPAAGSAAISQPAISPRARRAAAELGVLAGAPVKSGGAGG